MRSYPHIGDVVVESWMNTITFEVEDGDVNKQNVLKMREQSDYQTVDRDEVREGSTKKIWIRLG
jgi:hypothetical protein